MNCFKMCLVSIMTGVFLSNLATPYGGSTSGGQAQRAVVSGYRYSPESGGLINQPRRWYSAGRRFDGRVLNATQSRDVYFGHYRDIQKYPTSNTVHSRN